MWYATKMLEIQTSINKSPTWFKGGHGACQAPENMAQMGGKEPLRALLSGKRGESGGWAEASERERRGFVSGESISAHIIIRRHFVVPTFCVCTTIEEHMHQKM